MKIGDIVYFNTDGKCGKGEVVEIINDGCEYNCIVYLLGNLEQSGHDADISYEPCCKSYFYVEGELTDNRLWGKY